MNTNAEITFMNNILMIHNAVNKTTILFSTFKL